MTIYKLGTKLPEIHKTAFIASEATIIGDVHIHENTTVWPGAVLRGDNEPIIIGENTNLQEGAILHADPGFPLTIGQNVSVGHQAMLHGCSVGEGSLIGIQAIVLNGASIGRNCLVAAGAVVTENKSYPDRSLILGSPAKVFRELTDAEIADMHSNTADYVKKGKYYQQSMIPID
jgi:carbonic anhydrase/acetyltransferase-like protein (isoleucine patch superfamily)